MIRVRDGKLVEHWALLDSAAMQHQLGEGAET
jgi:predicted ester cyclase